ncbi:MAG: non-canonical purine NTP pyrophosphatase [Actinomycetota bacterium]|nr:non-canonical purine NTP pyrophosphatase [Actinomycetota bacterium]
MHKARELRAALPGWTVELLSGGPLPEETGETFYENARAKAEFGSGRSGASAWVVGEDSGLEVDALGRRPGIRSARYAGEHASDRENVAKLLRELEGVPAASRTARYVCELVCLGPGAEELRGSGTLEGAIAGAPRGEGGFGYDPVFVPAGQSRTVAELGDAWKAENSHRARAARALAALFRARSQAL